jgi:hypothetical protein
MLEWHEKAVLQRESSIRPSETPSAVQGHQKTFVAAEARADAKYFQSRC